MLKLNKQYFEVNNAYPIKNEHDTFETNENLLRYTVDGKPIVSKIPLALFRQRLIHHFDIWFKQINIVWPYPKNTATNV